ncbi:hypothetical protein FRC09_008071, partial [Ceratobasidium sp. 395]
HRVGTIPSQSSSNPPSIYLEPFTTHPSTQAGEVSNPAVIEDSGSFVEQDTTISGRSRFSEDSIPPRATLLPQRPLQAVTQFSRIKQLFRHNSA